MKPQDFFQLLAPYSSIISDAGLLPSVWMAQAALETGWGKVTKLGFNMWGIKHFYGEGISKDTREVEGGQNVFGDRLFQKYESIEEAARHYVWLLTEYPKFAGKLAGRPLEEYVNILGPLYATDAPAEVDGDPSYAEKILSIIARYGLEAIPVVEVNEQDV